MKRDARDDRFGADCHRVDDQAEDEDRDEALPRDVEEGKDEGGDYAPEVEAVGIDYGSQ